VYLTRTPSNAAAGTLVYAALDLETTGLNAHSDRVCEAAVVRFLADGTIVDEYTTLVDPQGPVQATEHHGISDEDVAGAPTFGEAWPDIYRMLTGSVVVAHNLPFDDRFLSAELARVGQPMPHLVGLCSAVTCRSQLEGPSYALQSLYRTATSEWIEDAHTALGDCRALATLMQWLLSNAPVPLWLAGPVPSKSYTPAFKAGRIVPRATRLSRRADGYLGAIARRFPLGADHPVDPEGARQYSAALDEIVSDHRITGDEGWRMELLARRAGFTQQRLVAEHRAAWERATGDLDLSQPDRLPVALRDRLVGVPRPGARATDVRGHHDLVGASSRTRMQPYEDGNGPARTSARTRPRCCERVADGRNRRVDATLPVGSRPYPNRITRRGRSRSSPRGGSWAAAAARCGAKTTTGAWRCSVAKDGSSGGSTVPPRATRCGSA
jgi:DNA polymerase III epsilon subunit-like protein